jgi:hypothetical protein
MVRMNKKLQVKNLKRLTGINSDLFDFESEVDGRLGYDENKTIITKKLRNRGLLKKTKTKKKVRAANLVSKALNINSKRKKRSRLADDNRRSKKTFNARELTKKQFIKWSKNKNKYDIDGVDNQGRQFKKRKLTKKQAQKFIDELDFDDI